MVQKIELTREQVAKVDDQDFEFLSKNRWYASYNKKLDGFYALRTQHIEIINGKQKQKPILMHRAIMEHIIGRKLKRNEHIDHINHDTLDNRRDNLRIVSHRQNNQNKKIKGTSKYPGVHWDKTTEKWRALIQINGKRKHLGYFVNEREAAKAYERACREICKEELICKLGED